MLLTNTWIKHMNLPKKKANLLTKIHEWLTFSNRPTPISSRRDKSFTTFFCLTKSTTWAVFIKTKPLWHSITESLLVNRAAGILPIPYYSLYITLDIPEVWTRCSFLVGFGGESKWHRTSGGCGWMSKGNWVIFHGNLRYPKATLKLTWHLKMDGWNTSFPFRKP